MQGPLTSKKHEQDYREEEAFQAQNAGHRRGTSAIRATDKASEQLPHIPTPVLSEAPPNHGRAWHCAANLTCWRGASRSRRSSIVRFPFDEIRVRLRTLHEE